MSVPVRPVSHLPHREFVGRPEAFDLLGARHFMLLFLLGLREHHTLLDFGCGSLRSGRLAMVYLDRGRYIGFDPNRWLIEAALEHEVGSNLVALKESRFYSDADFRWSEIGASLDFVHAHSVLTHAPISLVRSFFAQSGETLAPAGLILATYLRSDQDYEGTEWVYPELVGYRPVTMSSLARRHGLTLRHLRWPHTEQTYFVAARCESRIRDACDEVRALYGLDLWAAEDADPKGEAAG